LARVAPDAGVFVARELTKLYEQQLSGTPAAVAAALPNPVRGEIVLVVAGAERSAPAQATDDALDAEIDRAFSEGSSVATVARELARRGLGSRERVYRRALERRSGQGKPE
jgi:16S rRNA (cytidine1402-2'-O)-methyltransferase